jgi:aubergine-like protein
MVAGISLYGGTRRGAPGIIGWMSTIDPQLAKYHSFPYRYDESNKSERLKEAMTNAVNEYKKANGGTSPARAIVYREGIPGSQYEPMLETEVTPLGEALKAAAGSEGVGFTYLVVNKRTNAKFFLQKGGSSYDNPPMGTYVDSGVTKKDSYEFYLLPVSGKADQGAVTPVHYTVLYSQPIVPKDELVRMSYNMSFMYYNWSGSVKMPAPVINAHKLAY